MTPETWTGIAVVAGAIASAAAGAFAREIVHAVKRRKNGHGGEGRRDGDGPSPATLALQALDRAKLDSIDRNLDDTRHALSQPLQLMAGSLDLVRHTHQGVLAELQAVGGQLTALQVTLAGLAAEARNRCCVHCGK